MAALTLTSRSLTSFLYLASSFSSSVTLALTMAMLSFIRGTWSFMSRMFCSRIISGSSPTEIKNPTKDRTIRLNRLNIKAPPQISTGYGLGCGRLASAARATCDRVFCDEGRDRFGDPVLFDALLL